MSARAKTDSDVDLLVVVPFRGKEVHKSVEIPNRVEPEFPLDVIVRILPFLAMTRMSHFVLILAHCPKRHASIGFPADPRSAPRLLLDLDPRVAHQFDGLGEIGL